MTTELDWRGNPEGHDLYRGYYFSLLHLSSGGWYWNIVRIGNVMECERLEPSRLHAMIALRTKVDAEEIIETIAWSAMRLAKQEEGLAP